jgi:serine/threonine-protein kinase SRPK3
VAASVSDEEIADILNKDPPRYYLTLNILGHEIHPVVSQPLPCPHIPKEMLVFKLADFGHSENTLIYPPHLCLHLFSAQWYKKKVAGEISPLALRAPAMIQHHPWDENVDIWAIECLVCQTSF